MNILCKFGYHKIKTFIINGLCKIKLDKCIKCNKQINQYWYNGSEWIESKKDE